MILVSIVALIIVVGFLLRQTGFSLVNAILGRFVGSTIRIKSIGWKCINGIDVSLPNGWSLHIHTLTVRFFPAGFSKPLLLTFHDVRAEGATTEVTESNESDEVVEDQTAQSTSSNKLRRLNSLAQYIAIVVDSMHLIWLDSRAGCMLHFSVDDIRLEVFRGPRSWQTECSCRLAQGKAIERTSPSPALAEFSLKCSLSIDSSLEGVNVSLHEPVIALSHRALEICSSLELPNVPSAKRRPSTPMGIEGEDIPSMYLSNIDLSLTTFSFKYLAVIDGQSRSLCLSSSGIRLTRQGPSIQLLMNETSFIESNRRTCIRSAAIAIKAQLSSSIQSEVSISTEGATVVVSVADVLQWRSLAMEFIDQRGKMKRMVDTVEKKSIPSSSSSSLSSPTILVDISHLHCTIIGLDAKEWFMVAKLLNLTKGEQSLEMAADEVWLNRSGRQPVQGVHQWGELLCIGTAIMEFSRTPDGSRSIVIAADDCKVEWSEDVMSQMQQLALKMGLGGRISTEDGTSTSATTKGGGVIVETILRRVTTVASARDANMACVAMLEMTLRGDSSSGEWSVNGKECRLVSGMKAAEGLRLEDVLMAKKMTMPDWQRLRDEQRSWKQKEFEEMWHRIRQNQFERRTLALNANIHSIDIAMKQGREVSIQMDSEVELSWSPLIHTILLHLTRTTKGMISSLSRSSRSNPTTAHSSPHPPTSTRITLTATAAVQIDLELAEFHLMSWCAPIVQLEVSARKEMTVLTPSLQVKFNGVTFLNVTDVCISRRLLDTGMDSLRAATEGLLTSSNKDWSWTADKVLFHLPFQFNFAAAWDEFVTIIKWIKIMNGKRKGRPTDPPLAADLHVLIQEAILELEDDPFERKLQSNHELREDEVFECERRRQMLADHIATHIKTVPLFSQSKIDELYANLLAKNAEIYISRHSQLGENITPLFSSKWTRLEFRALADESMRRDDQCLALIQALDPAAPPPSSSVEWTTIWGRSVHISMEEWIAQFRDYPLPYALAHNLHLFGIVVAAERLSAGERSLRSRQVPLPAPWTTVYVHRNISPLKFFYDLQAESDDLTLNYGPSWEPALAMTSLQWNNISSPSRDPSPLLPFWDKMRFLLHGRLLWLSRKFVTNMLASLDPYNTSETLEWIWSDWGLDWGQGEMCTRSSLEVFLRTASRYDDSRILFLPRLNLRIEMSWNCLGQPYDHHAVELCTVDKLPHSATEHDSYRAFRSLSLNTVLSLAVHSEDEGEPPKVVMYANSIRCLDLLFKTISRTNANTRRGDAFGTPSFNKKQLSKHFRNVHISIKLPCFEIAYFMSQSSPQGLRLTCDQVELVSSLVQSAQTPTIDDKVRRRLAFHWTVEHISAALGETQVHVLGVDPIPSQSSSSSDSPQSSPSSLRPLLSFSRVVHTSEKGGGGGAVHGAHNRLTVHELRLSWTAAQRDVCLAIAEGAKRATLLRSMLGQHLSAILQAASDERRHYEQRRRKDDKDSSRNQSDRWEEMEEETTGEEPADLLEKLIEEADTKKVAHCEHSMDIPSDSLQGISQTNADDVIAITWHIELINSQMMLSGDAGKFALVSASRATLSQKIHRSVWRSAQLLGKKSWSAMLNGMQYFAPVSRSAWENEERSWLTKEEVEDKGSGGDMSSDRLNVMIGGGEAVGGMVTTENGRQLQRIISRCSCQIYWVSFSEKLDDKEEQENEVEENEEMEEELAVDCITLKHNILEASSNSEQYSLAVDLVNQLVLFVDPRMKKNAEKRNRRLFECRQLSMEDMIRSIETQQNKLREVVCLVRSIERQLFHLDNHGGDSERRIQLVREMDEYKRKQLDVAEHMAITISVLKQRQVQQTRVVTSRMEEEVPIVRKFEVCFEDCTWKLTEHDGMIAIAQLHITNFLYTRTMRVDNGGEHLFELGTIRVSNLLRDSPFPDTVDRDSRFASSDSAIRILCKDLAPVGGIAVKEHFEVNIAPMVVQFTYRFFDSMMTFFFPERNKHANEANLDTDEGGGERPARRFSLTRRITGGLSIVRSSSGRAAIGSNSAIVDEIDKMRARANSNNLFLYIKIPEVPILVSYKGNKEKNIEDVRNLSLIFPFCEYHEKNWTWLDLSIAIKQRSRRVLLQQFMKQKLLRNRTKGENIQPMSDEDKKRIAIGTTPVLTEKQKK